MILGGYNNKKTLVDESTAFFFDDVGILGPTPPVCGDGTTDPGEDCDDGGTVGGDCCSATCSFEPVSSPCDDGSACTENDTCNGAGTCDPGPPPDCDDGDVCTADSCDQVTGCGHDPIPGCGTQVPAGPFWLYPGLAGLLLAAAGLYRGQRARRPSRRSH